MIGSRLLNRYELTNELGRGGMGVVYRAHDPWLDREVAVKVIPAGRLNPENEERFQREARLVAAMDHPSIVTIHDFGRHEGALFFVMPWAQGRLLREWIREAGLNLDETLDIAVQVAEGLDYSHSHGVIHRDVKPDNIMVARDGGRPRVRVMDFGLAHGTTAERLTRSGGLLGTLVYLSPEQVATSAVDGRSDIYSLGTVLYECLAGEPPFSGTIYSLLYRISHEPPRSLKSRGVEIDDELDEIVMRCLAKDPGARFQRGRDLAEVLARHRQQLQREGRSAVIPSAPVRGSLAQLPLLVGREAEIEKLRSCLDAATSGECRLFLVAGEAGVGKTRLLDELAALARRRNLQVLRSRFADRESAIPYQGLCELIQDFFRARRQAPSSSAEAGAEDPLIPQLADLATDLVTLFPVLSEIPELRAASLREEGEDDDTGIVAFRDSGRDRAAYVFELLARTLSRLAGEAPMVLLLEDLHAGDVSIEALRYIVHRLAPMPFLIAGSYRHTEIDREHPLSGLIKSFQDDPRCSSITLEPLQDDAFRALLATELGSDEMEESLVRQVRSATEGNPSFALELVRSLVATGEVQRSDDGAWSFSGSEGIAAHALPETMQQAVERRIERLAPELREVLSVASVLGRSFEFEDLGKLLEEIDALPDLDLEEAVDALIGHELLAEERKRRGDWLSFTRGVVRDVLYQELSRRKRRMLHRRHAFELERRHRDHLERVEARLVHHFAMGGVAEKTVTYALEVARSSLLAFSPEDAILAAETALERVEEVMDSPRAEGQLREILARAHRQAGSNVRALEEASRAANALESAGALEQLARTTLLAAEIAWHLRRMEDVGKWVYRGIEPARAARADQVLRKLLTLGATVANLRGEVEIARELMVEAEELARSDPNRSTGTGSTEGLPLIGGTLVTALRSPVLNLDPGGLKTFEEQEIASNVFETLVSTDADGHLVPWLCEEWRSLDDETRFVFVLRSEVRFSDGTSLSSRHVKLSLERAARRRAYSPLPAIAAVVGAEELLSGSADEIRGIELEDERTLAFRLKAPLPIFPALLTDLKAAVCREVRDEEGHHEHLGTGPFRILSHDPGLEEPGRVVLQRDSSYWREYPAALERIEFLTSYDGSRIATGLRTGTIDVGRDLLPEDLEEFLRDPRFRRRLVETTMRDVYFAVFNTSGPTASNAELRRALTVLRSGLVWRTLGRFAQPAVGLIPPGVLGHDPGRRLPTLPLEEARELLRRSGLAEPIQLRAAVHPMFQDRFGGFLNALLETWQGLGVEVTNATPTMKSYISRWGRNEDVDLMIGRWNGDYDDPDSFTHGLFHSREGVLRLYFSSAEADRILEQARRERQAAPRHALYRRFEDLLSEQSVLLPLFHEVDYRLGSPLVRGLRLRSTLPYVNYSEISKLARAPSRRPRAQLVGGGEIHTAIGAAVETLDPARSSALESLELASTVFETLTRIDQGAQTVPWLAAAFESVQGGRSYRVRLRPNVRFHDGRRLSARDVRYSYERALKAGVCPLLPLRGARELQRGETLSLSGLRLVSATELVFELEEPVSFFPALLAQTNFAIVPEGTEDLGTDWRHGCVGTGPFRVVHFQRGERLDLEKNTHYWRPARPKSDRLLFHLGLSPARLFADFREGRLSVVSGLRPTDVEALCHNPKFAGGYHESPRLATSFLAMNTRRGPFQDLGARRALVRGVDVASALEENMGRLATQASGLIPPGLLGAEDVRRTTERSLAGAALSGLRLRAAVSPTFLGPYASFWDRLCRDLEAGGVAVDVIPGRLGAAVEEETFDLGTFDLVVDRWDARYPDADSFAMGLLHTELGRLGSFCGSPEIDALAERGRRLAEPGRRHATYREIEEIVAREALLAPLFYEHAYRFCQPSIKGLYTDFSLPGVRYEDLAQST